jgi:phosphoribosylaminoimidazolecarboxamide formyltransferase/IMP cyclohydrolase
VTLKKIDIGGIALPQKNFKDTVIIASVDEYSLLLDLITDQDGATTLADRKLLATKAFHVSSMTHPFSTISIRMKLFSKQVLQMVKPEIWRKPHQKDSSLVILTPCLNYTEKNYHTITYLM